MPLGKQRNIAELDKFRYIYVLYHLHLSKEDAFTLRVCPPWAKGRKVGLFASRSPDRPVSIGLSVVRLRSVENGELVTGLIDVYDQTPLLDIKPYIRELDSKTDANFGWFQEVDGYQHLIDHMRGIPHKH